MGGQGLQVGTILAGLAEDGHVGMVFGRRPHQGRTADINLLDRLSLGNPFPGNGLLKGIEIDHHQLHGTQLVFRQVGLIGGEIRPS